MKKKIIELDVDFIGGQEPLTKDEEILIHNFFQTKKMAATEKEVEKRQIKSQKKELV
jgi:hypothetical protein